jgi:hypothetical protein
LKEEICCYETIQKGIVEFGIDSESLGELIAKYGKEILDTISSAIKHGLSKDFILETLNRFGPILLNLLVSVLSKKVFGAEGDVVAEQEKVVDGVLKDIFMTRILPRMLEKHGDELADALIEALIKYLKDNS